MIHILPIIIGFIIMTMETWGAQPQHRPLPTIPTPTPHHAATTTTQPSHGVHVLKEATQFMVNEFHDACNSHISIINSLRPAPHKPNGYGTSIPYYTPQDKAGLVNQLKSLMTSKTAAAHKTLSELEAKEKTQGGQLSVPDIMKAYISIAGTLNEGRKNCTLSLTQMEKQDLKTQTLKECGSTLQNDKAPNQNNPEKGQQKKSLLSKQLPKAMQRGNSSTQSGKAKSDDDKGMAIHQALKSAN